ncbi:Chemotaxis protein CheA [Moorella thermoacetica]|uniref:Chemotaxis protein CheA n=1 Tax=Neomoorella thermoacetica TaxID=1525 RepID=A0AAC9HFU0_NEOTH|nr:chemotaxis protein CheA [Moorella thermoacetica]AOQ23014.1 Chemotaxis protein CheA [Moorella thermoacetica]TYL07256.1 Chemotaxis protein CheA [Moorella thermoacetica]
MEKGSKTLRITAHELGSRDVWPLLREMEEKGWLGQINLLDYGEEYSLEIEVRAEQDIELSERLIKDYLEGKTVLGNTSRTARDMEREMVENQTVRVEQGKIDKLLALAGELIVSTNVLTHLVRRLEDLGLPVEMVREFKEYQSSLSRTSWGIQDVIMEMRLMPVGFVFERFRRLVRELGQELGKKVQFKVIGDEVTIDRNVAATIYEPLLHLVRNALDHGLERPEERIRSGKSEEGELLLKAERKGEHVVIAVKDDGAGIDTGVVKSKAVSRGLITQEQAERMGFNEALELIFAPGFSTKDEVSAVSGRGVGMDVVRETVERLGGKVMVSSELGVGTEIALELPISMSITKVVLLDCGGLYGIPVGEVKEIVKVEASRLHSLKESEVVVLRETIYPVVRLSRVLDASAEGVESDELTLIVLLAGVAVAVPKVLGEQDVVLKNLPPQLSHLKLFTGAAILGNGDIALILDTSIVGRMV